MKTRNQLLRHLFVVAALFATLQFSVAQDDDHTVTDVSGRTYLDVNENIPAAPWSFTVGTTPSNVGALIVRGEQMSTPTGITLNTYANYNLEHAWRMNKILQNGTAEYIGRILCTNAGYRPQLPQRSVRCS
jgi:4-aminobutyrate aminotransferase-like enzyme